jgi:hypothetical protein
MTMDHERSEITTVSSPAGALNYRPLAPGADRLPDGPRVWWMTSEFDCLACCVATIFGCDYSEVPPGPAGDHTKVEELQALERLHGWVRERGYQTRYSEIGRPLFNRYWIGVNAARPGFGHAVVCLCRTLVFDPALAHPVPVGCAVEPVRELHYAIAFDRLEAK